MTNDEMLRATSGRDTDDELRHRVLVGMDAMRVCLGMDPVNAPRLEIDKALSPELAAVVDSQIAEIERLRARVAELESAINNIATGIRSDPSNLQRTVYLAVTSVERAERAEARVAELEAERDEAWAALIEPWPECLGEEGRQELLASLGLIAPQTVTERMRDTCNGECWCGIGDICYRLTAAGETALRTTAKRAALRGEEG